MQSLKSKCKHKDQTISILAHVLAFLMQSLAWSTLVLSPPKLKQDLSFTWILCYADFNEILSQLFVVFGFTRYKSEKQNLVAFKSYLRA